MGKRDFQEDPEIKCIFCKENCAWKPKYKMKEAGHRVKKREMDLIKRKRLKGSHLHVVSYYASDSMSTYLPNSRFAYMLVYLASPLRYLRVLSNVHVQNNTPAPTSPIP